MATVIGYITCYIACYIGASKGIAHLVIKIINTTELQQRVSQIVKDVQHKPHVVINKGKAKMILLPYFDGCDEFIEHYWRASHGPELQKRYQQSMHSGISDVNL